MLAAPALALACAAPPAILTIPSETEPPRFEAIGAIDAADLDFHTYVCHKLANLGIDVELDGECVSTVILVNERHAERACDALDIPVGAFSVVLYGDPKEAIPAPPPQKSVLIAWYPMAEGSIEERWEVPQRAFHFLNAAQLNVRGDSRTCYYLSVDADEVERAITILHKKRSQLPGLRVLL